MTDPRFKKHKLGAGSQIHEKLPCCRGLRTVTQDANGVVVDERVAHDAGCTFDFELRKRVLAPAPEPITMQEAVPCRSCHCGCECGQTCELHE